MSSPVRVLGFASKSEAVVAFRAQGLSSRQIAHKLGIEVKSVSALEASMRRRQSGRTEQAWYESHSTRNQHTVAIDNDTLKALRPHAARRNTTVNRLVRELINIIADDGLVDALLDDDA